MIELENEADATASDAEARICWQRSAHLMPRLRIVTELEEYVIPWVHVAMVKSDRSRKVIEIHTSLGLQFTIASSIRLDLLFALLQLERIKAIFPVDGVTVKVATMPGNEN